MPDNRIRPYEPDAIHLEQTAAGGATPGHRPPADHLDGGTAHDDSLLDEIEAACAASDDSLEQQLMMTASERPNGRPRAIDVGFAASPAGEADGNSTRKQASESPTTLARSTSPGGGAPSGWWNEFKGSMTQVKMKDSVESVERGTETSAQGWKALLYPSLPWGLPAYVNSRKTGSTFLQVWDIVIALAILYTAFIIPLSLGFEKVFFRSGDKCLFSSDIVQPFIVTRWIDILADILFIIDIALNFVSARWVFHGGTKKHWELVDDVDQIAKMYLKDTFATDFLGTLPVQYLDCIPSVSAGSVKVLRLFRLFKLLRLRGLSNMLRKLETMMPHSRFVIILAKIFLSFIGCAHLIGCLFFFVAFGFGDPDGHVDSEDGTGESSLWFAPQFYQRIFLESWVVDDGLVREDGSLAEGKTPFDAWVTAFYWSVTTMSTIGYGDISPNTLPERLVSCLLMVIACACFAWITGTITSIMTYKPLCEARFDEALNDIETFMSTRHLPKDLRRKILNYYKMRYPNKRIWDEEAIIGDIESPSIRTDIVVHLFRDVVEMVPLLSLCDVSTQREISTKLRSIYRMPGRVITYERTVPDFLYIVRFGQVDLKGWGLKPQTIAYGDIFGEMAMLGLSPDGLRMRTATAVSVVEVCQLAEKDLHELLIHRPGFFNLVKEVCRTHMFALRMAKERMAQISASHEYKYDAASPNQPAVKDFYEQLTTMQWREVCAVIRQKQEAEAFRSDMANFDNGRVKRMERADGRKMLRTSLALNFKTLSFLQLEGSQARHDPGSMTGMSALIVGRWKGLDGMPFSCVQNETDRFFLDAVKGSPCIAQHMVLPIASPHGVLWQDLTSLELCIMHIPSGTETGLMHAKGAPPRQRVMQNDPTAPIASKVVQKATVWLTGTLSLHDAILKRTQETSRKATTWVELSSPDGFKAKMEVEVVAKRIPQCEGWGKLMHIVAARGASPFFTKKLDTLLEKVEAKEEAFVELIRSQRLSRMRTLQMPNGNRDAHSLLETTDFESDAARASPSPHLFHHAHHAHHEHNVRHVARNRRASRITTELQVLLREGKLEEEASCLAAYGVLDVEDLSYMTEDDVVKFGLPLKFRGLLQQVASARRTETRSSAS